MWRCHVLLLKVLVFVWRPLHNRLPAKDILLRREVLHEDSRICIRGFGADEFVDFFFCDRFDKIWDLILNLLNIYRVLSNFASDHATLFDGLILCSKNI